MKFDKDFLNEVGLGEMPEEQKESFLKYIQEEAEVKVGEKITEGMSEAKVMELEMCEGDEETLEWLKVNRPNFREIIDEVMAGIREMIEKGRDQILMGAQG